MSHTPDTSASGDFSDLIRQANAVKGQRRSTEKETVEMIS